jgi:hypothetical protein
MTVKERNALGNLILLCPNHHRETDDVSRYPPHVMMAMKFAHENKIEKGVAFASLLNRNPVRIDINGRPPILLEAGSVDLLSGLSEVISEGMRFPGIVRIAFETEGTSHDSSTRDIDAAVSFIRSGRFNESIATLLALRPSADKAIEFRRLANLAASYFFKEQLADAENYARQASSLAADKGVRFEYLAMAAVASKRWQAVLDIFETAVIGGTVPTAALCSYYLQACACLEVIATYYDQVPMETFDHEICAIGNIVYHQHSLKDESWRMLAFNAYVVHSESDTIQSLYAQSLLANATKLFNQSGAGVLGDVEKRRLLDVAGKLEHRLGLKNGEEIRLTKNQIVDACNLAVIFAITEENERAVLVANRISPIIEDDKFISMLCQILFDRDKLAYRKLIAAAPINPTTRYLKFLDFCNEREWEDIARFDPEEISSFQHRDGNYLDLMRQLALLLVSEDPVEILDIDELAEKFGTDQDLWLVVAEVVGSLNGKELHNRVWEQTNIFDWSLMSAKLRRRYIFQAMEIGQWGVIATILSNQDVSGLNAFEAEAYARSLIVNGIDDIARVILSRLDEGDFKDHFEARILFEDGFHQKAGQLFERLWHQKGNVVDLSYALLCAYAQEEYEKFNGLKDMLFEKFPEDAPYQLIDVANNWFRAEYRDEAISLFYNVARISYLSSPVIARRFSDFYDLAVADGKPEPEVLSGARGYLLCFEDQVIPVFDDAETVPMNVIVVNPELAVRLLSSKIGDVLSLLLGGRKYDLKLMGRYKSARFLRNLIEIRRRVFGS